MPLTEEERIRRHYRGLRRRWGSWSNDYGGEHSFSREWLMLARRWKRPVQEIKRIVRTGGGNA